MSAVDESPPKLWAEFKKPRDVDAQVIQSMRVFWYRGDAVDPRTKLPIRRLRFAREGEMDGTTWARHVAALLGNRLPHDLAPCVWHGGDTGEVRSVSRREIDWEGIEEREWRMLRASGLDAMTQHRLIAGEHDEPSEPADLAADEAAEVEPTDVDVEADREERRAAVRGLLEHLPEGPIVARVEAATSALELQRQSYEGERARFAAGQSDLPRVLQAQASLFGSMNDRPDEVAVSTKSMVMPFSIKRLSAARNRRTPPTSSNCSPPSGCCCALNSDE